MRQQVIRTKCGRCGAETIHEAQPAEVMLNVTLSVNENKDGKGPLKTEFDFSQEDLCPDCHKRIKSIIESQIVLGKKSDKADK